MRPVDFEVLSAPVRSYLERNLGPPDHYSHLRDVELLRRTEFDRVVWNRKLTRHYRQATNRVRQETFADGETDSEALKRMRARNPAELPRLEFRQMELERHIDHLENFLGIEGEELKDVIQYMKQRMFL